MDYTPITPIPSTARDMASTELASLAQVWRDRRAELDEDGALDAFRTRLIREWAVETGLIERLYTWDRGVTEVLISQGIHATIISHHARVGRAHADHIAALIADQQQVIEGLYDLVTEDRPLTEHDIRAMHQVMTAHQETTDALDAQGQRYAVDLLRGQYKQRPNSPRRRDGTTHAYCPPEHTADEMARLIAWYHEAEAIDPPLAPEVLSAWLHHRFTQVHPFQDGNGRIARALASFVFLKHRLFPLVIRDQDRDAYIDALEAADDGDLAPLVRLFVDRQRAALLGAIAERPSEARGPEQVFASVIRARQRREAKALRYAPAYDTAARLAEVAYDRLLHLSESANAQLAPLGQPYRVTVRSDRTGASDKTEIPSALGRTLPSSASPSETKPLPWIQFTIETADIFSFLMAFHPTGDVWQGLVQVLAVTHGMAEGARRSLELTLKDLERSTTGGSPRSREPAAVRPDPFQFNYAEPPEATERRFRDWLEETITLALAVWQQDPGL